MPRNYAHARVAPGDSTSSLKKDASATRRWTRAETRSRAEAAEGFHYPSPTPSQLCDLVSCYEQITGDIVRTRPKRNLLAACYRVHGDDFLALVRETFARTGTATNLLGELRVLQPRQARPAADPDSPTPAMEAASSQRPRTSAGRLVRAKANGVDTDSAWCGCPEEVLRPGLLYCEVNRPKFGSAPKRRYDRRPSNPAATSFFSARAEPSATGALRP